MEIVTVRFQEDILQKIDESIAMHNFNSRTEFIREAVRKELADLDREKLIKEFLSYRGKAKVKVSDEQIRKAKEEVSKELLADLEKRFS